MTFAELQRYFDSKARVRLEEERKKATYDYILADMIGRSISRLYGSNNKMPTISEAYPTLFEDLAQKQQEQKENLSVIRFKQFAQFHNKKFEEVGKT